MMRAQRPLPFHRTVTIGVRFCAEDAAMLRSKAKEMECSYSELVRRAVLLYTDDRPWHFCLTIPPDDPNLHFDLSGQREAR